MRLKQLEIAGFKSFGKKSVFEFTTPISAVVGPNGSGKSNVMEAIRFVTGEQSLKSLRGKKGEDLIFNGSQTAPRASSARVTIVFDNRHRELNVDFDDVIIAREVARDGSNSYYINDTQVRLRDIYELLSAANIGASSHHIISQGEADRILNASTKERKEMIEEALGLKLYQWKIDESEKKLEKTEQNIKEAELLRREIAPHLRYLKKQVEKIEEGRALREELRGRYVEYLRREELYVQHAGQQLAAQRQTPASALAEVETRIAELSSLTQEGGETRTDDFDVRIGAIRRSLADIRSRKEEITRKIGRIDGVLEYKKTEDGDQAPEGVMVSADEVQTFFDYIDEEITRAETSEDVTRLRDALSVIRSSIKNFISRVLGGHTQEAKEHKAGERAREIDELMTERETLHAEFSALEEQERKLFEEEAGIRRRQEEKQVTLRESERALYELKNKRTELHSEIHEIDNRVAQLDRERRDFEEECTEAVILAGERVRDFSSFDISEESVLHEPRAEQEARRKHIERLKIRIEDIGGGSGEEVLKEYNDTKDRDAYLERELEDLEKSAVSLKQLIEELAQKINTEFKQGLTKINKQFQEFFALMFDGGTASLSVVQERKRKRRSASDEELEDAIAMLEGAEEETEEGVEVHVNLPRKKIRGLVMLSGGERALTSIALLFAISQVNPPPFLVLDETDAALDESNSRKYGDMLENLSEFSQLIVVTHNRETMSRAGVLYGVTMGADAVSRVLSVKFDEAAAMAK